MAIFNGRNYTLADFLPFNYTKIWDQFWNDVLVELGLRAAAVGAALVATSSTSTVTIGTGAKTLTIESGKGFAAGMWVVARDADAAANSMTGRVTSYTPGTGVLVLDVAAGDVTGSGTPASWTVGISGRTGARGDAGPVTTYWGGTAGGTANALTATTGASLSSLTKGMVVGVKIGATANGGAATLAVDGLSPVAIRKDGAALAGGELVANADRYFQHDGTYWRLTGGGLPAASNASTSTGTSTTEAVTPASLAAWINGLPEMTAGQIDTAADYLAAWDASATIMKKVKPSNLGIASTTSGGTWDAGNKAADVTLSNGALTAANSAVSSSGGVRATRSVGPGKYYFEVALDVVTALSVAGLVKSVAGTGYPGNNSSGYGYTTGGSKITNGSGSAYGSSVVAGGVVQFWVDATNPSSISIWIGVNGVVQGGGDPVAGTSPAYSGIVGPLYPAWGRGGDGTSNASQATLRLSQSSWAHNSLGYGVLV